MSNLLSRSQQRSLIQHFLSLLTICVCSRSKATFSRLGSRLLTHLLWAQLILRQRYKQWQGLEVLYESFQRSCPAPAFPYWTHQECSFIKFAATRFFFSHGTTAGIFALCLAVSAPLFCSGDHQFIPGKVSGTLPNHSQAPGLFF